MFLFYLIVLFFINEIYNISMINAGLENNIYLISAHAETLFLNYSVML